jgi:predicted Zn-dependent peptidase
VDKVGEAIRIILEEYRKLKRAAVPKAELERNKDLLRGRTVLHLESSDAMVNWFGRQAVLLDTIAREEGKKKKLRLASPKKYLEAVNGITAKDIKRTAQDIFTSQGLNLALIGPFKNKASIKRMLKM